MPFTIIILNKTIINKTNHVQENSEITNWKRVQEHKEEHQSEMNLTTLNPHRL